MLGCVSMFSKNFLSGTSDSQRWQKIWMSFFLFSMATKQAPCICVRAAIRGVTKSWTQFSNWTTTILAHKQTAFNGGGIGGSHQWPLFPNSYSQLPETTFPPVSSKCRAADSFPLLLVPTYFTPLLFPSPAYTCVDNAFITFSSAEQCQGLIWFLLRPWPFQLSCPNSVITSQCL